MQSVALYTVAGLILTAVGTLGVAPALIRGRIGKHSCVAARALWPHLQKRVSDTGRGCGAKSLALQRELDSRAISMPQF